MNLFGGISPLQLVGMIKNGASTPDVILSMFESQTGGNPIMQNVLKMAKNGDRQGLESFARNVCKEKGKDFDTEFESFLKQFGLK